MKLPKLAVTRVSFFIKNMETIPEEFGFEINPICKICNSPHKPDIDRMLMEGVKTRRIIEYCQFINPDTGRARVVGNEMALKKNLCNHKKHITIDQTKIVEQAQMKSMTLYKNKVEGEISIARASELAQGRMIDVLSDATSDLTMQELAIPVQLHQKERSVKVEESAMQLELAKFINGNKNEKLKPGGADEIKGLADTIRNAEKCLRNIDAEIRAIAGGGEAARS